MRRLQKQIPDFVFDAWIAPLDAKICEDRLALGCPTSFHRDRVRLHHLATLERCWQDACREAGCEPVAPLELMTPKEFADADGQPVDPSILRKARALHEASLQEQERSAALRAEMRKVESGQQAQVANGPESLRPELRPGAASPTVARGSAPSEALAPIALPAASSSVSDEFASLRAGANAGTHEAGANESEAPSTEITPETEPVSDGRTGPSLRIVGALSSTPSSALSSALSSAPFPAPSATASPGAPASLGFETGQDEAVAGPIAGGPLRKSAEPVRNDAQARGLSREAARGGLEFGLEGEPTAPAQPFSFDSFVMGPCNTLAREAALALARRRQRSLNQLYLAGGSGMGKTHLARATAEEARIQLAGDVGADASGNAGARPRASATRTIPSGPRGPRRNRQAAGAARILFTSAEQFTSEFVSAMRNGRNEAWTKRYRGPIELLIVEDIHYLVGRTKTQQELYHTIEHVLDSGGRVLLTGDRAPRDLTGLDEKMRALVARGFVAELDRPDAMVRRHLLRAKAAAGGVHLPADCLDLLVDATESGKGSVRDVEGALIQVVTTASLLGRPIDLALTRDAIALKSGASSVLAPRKLEVAEVVRLVATFFSTRPETLASRSRRRDVLVPRQLSMYLANRYTEASLTEIGRGLGRDHPSVRNAIQRIERQVLENAPVRYQVEALTERIERYLEDREG